MQITIDVNQEIRAKSLRYVADPDAQAASMYEHWAQLAQQQNPGVDLLTLPTIVEQEAARLREAEIAAQEQVAFAAQVDAILAQVPEALREAVTAQAQDLRRGGITEDEAKAKIAELQTQAQVQFNRDVERQRALMREAYARDPQLRAAMAAVAAEPTEEQA